MESTRLPWQNDWNDFVKVLGERLRQGADSEKITAEFGSQLITWTGTLKAQLLDDPAPMVTISLPEAEIRLGDSGSVHLSDLSVPAARDAVSVWQDIPIGTCLSFTAVLGGSSVFPPVQVHRLSTGRTVVMVTLGDGRPSSQGRCESQDGR